MNFRAGMCRPYGTFIFFYPEPGIKMPGYYLPSLWDFGLVPTLRAGTSGGRSASCELPGYYLPSYGTFYFSRVSNPTLSIQHSAFIIHQKAGILQ